MDWIIENWAVLVVIFAIAFTAAFTVAKFFNKPTDEQAAAIKEWLLYAVTMAEKELGGGTGKLKLRQVYDMFVVRFPWVARAVSFDRFSVWVDEALITMRKLMENGGAVQKFVEG